MNEKNVLYYTFIHTLSWVGDVKEYIRKKTYEMSPSSIWRRIICGAQAREMV